MKFNFFSAQTNNTILNIYDFVVKDINGENFYFNKLKGKKIMIVNTASKCGLTPQYKKLEALYKEFSTQNFVIVGFPANNFLGQEPGTNEEISVFCEKQYGVTFPMMSKISVKGTNIHPLFAFLTKKNLNGFSDSSVKWNFQKFLIGTDGKLEMVASPWTSPDDSKIINWIKG